MANKRQKQARKLFKGEHPESFPNPEPTPSKNPKKQKRKRMMKKKGMFGREKAGSRGMMYSGDVKKRILTKHPLRVPGMKPGESCYICKAPEHIAKHCPRKALWEKHKICLLCRQHGHSLKSCPSQSDDATNTKFCYNCGLTGHSLSGCHQPLQDGGVKFATCFICNEQGHLSKNCTRNTHGVYPKGGCCKICGAVTHLAKDCPNKSNRESGAASEAGKPGKGLNISGLARGKITKFVSGDELDDDFVADDTRSNKKVKSSECTSIPDSELSTIKPKKKHGRRVVNFVG